MNAKHTPGPWVRDTRGFPHADVRAESGRAVAVTWGVCSSTPKSKEAYNSRTETERANANLIAAAPDLLALARRVARIGQHPAPGQRECLCGQCDMVRTAINLVKHAEGGAE